MVHYYRYEEDNVYCKDGYRFPAVYAFYDEYGNLLYIGKSNDLGYRMGVHFARGHLKDHQYKQVRRVMFHRCKTEADAGILEIVLLAYYKPPFNQFEKGDLPTIVDVEEMISSLDWKVYFDDTCFSSEEKNELFRTLLGFDVWHDSARINFLESAYEKYIVKHKNDKDEELRMKYEDLFEMVLVKYIGSYDRVKDRERFCNAIRNSYLPDIDYKWFEFCRKRMNLESYNTYGDVYRAFAENRHVSRECIEKFKKFSFVQLLDEYDFGKLPTKLEA